MKPGAIGVCPYCKEVLYECISVHTMNCEVFGKDVRIEPLKAPFPWFGGKSRVSRLVWERFGNAPNYVEPFFGSGAVLLGRPHNPGNEIINDRDCYVSNAWRAIQMVPEEVSAYADAPVNEADLHARHTWLHKRNEFRDRMQSDPEYFDARIAGWWIWGLSCWTGDNFCRPKPQEALPHLTGGKGDRGVNAGSLRTEHKRPVLEDRGINAKSFRQTSNLLAWFQALSDRLRFTKVCCGDWSRVLTPAATWGQGLTAVFLDPPYDTYSHDDVYGDLSRNGASSGACEWALENGDNPLLRIALCGYEGEHDMPDSWECVAWKAGGGYGNQSGNENRKRERIWFSPHCLRPEAGPLFRVPGPVEKIAG